MSHFRLIPSATSMLAFILLVACGGEPPQPTGPEVEASGGAADAAPMRSTTAAVAPPQGEPESAPGASASTAPVVQGEPSPFYIFPHARMEPETDVDGKPMGVRVISVQPRGRVDLAGIQAGDVILYIDGIKLDRPESFPRAVRLVEDVFLRGKPQRIHVLRGGKRMALIPLGPVRLEPAPAAPAP